MKKIVAKIQKYFRQQRLIKALKSGEYSQTQGCLRDDTGFCCLGVACDIYRREVGASEWEKRDIGYRILGDSSFLPRDVREYFGFRDIVGSFSGSALTTLNDQGRSFQAIAEVIKINRKKIFK